eukprot:TRINITY_DN7770_c0_g1_i1.p1 TRINITY_DN7770_c0_g1~~TRINITY_DN7770_c0_g1_i1.p1  ORF type:complete len:184 (-),score=42.15 TRINITY_DN7770_c0_g1_i1:50-601(-)
MIKTNLSKIKISNSLNHDSSNYSPVNEVKRNAFSKVAVKLLQNKECATLMKTCLKSPDHETEDYLPLYTRIEERKAKLMSQKLLESEKKQEEELKQEKEEEKNPSLDKIADTELSLPTTGKNLRDTSRKTSRSSDNKRKRNPENEPEIQIEKVQKYLKDNQSTSSSTTFPTTNPPPKRPRKLT